MCSVPRERYCPLGHRALLVMSAGKEEELAGLGGTLSFLTQQRSEELQQVRGPLCNGFVFVTGLAWRQRGRG